MGIYFIMVIEWVLFWILGSYKLPIFRSHSESCQTWYFEPTSLKSPQWAITSDRLDKLTVNTTQVILRNRLTLQSKVKWGCQMIRPFLANFTLINTNVQTLFCLFISRSWPTARSGRWSVCGQRSRCHRKWSKIIQRPSESEIFRIWTGWITNRMIT